MIAWLMGIITLILLIFIIWRGRSRTMKDHFEHPKFQFLKNLGVDTPANNNDSKTDSSEENNHARRNP
jgi:hypothetical protein